MQTSGIISTLVYVLQIFCYIERPMEKTNPNPNPSRISSRPSGHRLFNIMMKSPSHHQNHQLNSVHIFTPYYVIQIYVLPLNGHLLCFSKIILLKYRVQSSNFCPKRQEHETCIIISHTQFLKMIHNLINLNQKKYLLAESYI